MTGISREILAGFVCGIFGSWHVFVLDIVLLSNLPFGTQLDMVMYHLASLLVNGVYRM